ncbi:MAG: DUF1553 domain-containing protein [Planctomycetota bacterium]|nr:DUF1553 domain-containing protein [Planctomycetota bacterium]
MLIALRILAWPLILMIGPLACTILPGHAGTGSSFAEDHLLRFEKTIRPILKAHCFHCHGEEGVRESGLDLRLTRFIQKGGDSGSAINLEHPDQSLLLKKVISGEMPPEDKKLSTGEIALIREWIQSGARTTRPEPETIADDHLTDEEKSFWSFQPIRDPSLPRIGVNAEIQTPVDSFVLEKLRKEKLDFSPAASRETLVRRLYFDLLGLPPEPQQVKAFLEDRSPDAFAKLVDQLLISPRYGERWGRHWLDVAGYADSEGYTDKDPVREFAFFYRDYVIDSFNEGMPFDQFVVEQLAGDELVTSPLDSLTIDDQRRLKATGFLRMAPDGTASGGVDRNVSTNQTVADTINIVSTSLLGLTVGCARCHNHRYDPITHVDYHRMRAILEPALDWKKWKNPQQRQVSLYTDDEKKIRADVEARAKKVETERSQKQAAHIERTLYEELLVAPDEKRDALQKAYKTEKSKRSPDQVALLEEFPNIQNISTGSLYLYAEQRARRANEILAEAKKREEKLLSEIRETHLAKASPEVLDALKSALTTEAAKRNPEQLKLAEQYPGVFVSSQTLDKFNGPGATRIAEYRKAAERCRKLDAKTELAKMAEEAARIRQSAPREFFVRALMEPDNHTPPTHLFKRGNHSQPAQQVGPGELSVLGRAAPASIPVNDPGLKTTGRRLAYAKHLTGGRHPLLARVIVNRIWLHHFGRGIVQTTGDFGTLGTPPTHPELLDWLATEFMRSGWNLKQLQRLILLSRTYQQVSTRTDQLDRVDPENLWYGRQNIRRLESEILRDSVLAVSGQMVNRMHGPSIPVKEDGVGQIVLGKQKLDGERKPQPGNQLGADAERRSLYVQVRRTRPLAVLESFDIATHTPNCLKRHFSTVAPQSLMLMNSDFILRYADLLAKRLQRESSDAGQQINTALEICYSRFADPQMVGELEKYLAEQRALFQQHSPKTDSSALDQKALASLCHALLSSNEFLYVD